MNVRVFVSLGAVLLIAWMSVTWVLDEPWQDYPVLGKGSVPVSAKLDS